MELGDIWQYQMSQIALENHCDLRSKDKIFNIPANILKQSRQLDGLEEFLRLLLREFRVSRVAS